jgi:hypothetical protein
MNFVEFHATVGQHLTSYSRFEDTILCQGCVSPSNKPVVTIPGTLAMSKKAQIVRGIIVDAGKLSLS